MVNIKKKVLNPKLLTKTNREYLERDENGKKIIIERGIYQSGRNERRKSNRFLRRSSTLNASHDEKRISRRNRFHSTPQPLRSHFFLLLASSGFRMIWGLSWINGERERECVCVCVCVCTLCVWETDRERKRENHLTKPRTFVRTVWIRPLAGHASKTLTLSLSLSWCSR